MINCLKIDKKKKLTKIVKWLKNRKNRRKLLKNRKNRSMLRKIGKTRNLTPCIMLEVARIQVLFALLLKCLQSY